MSSYYPYDYAWKTAGWSVQNPGYVAGSNSYIDPGMPDDVTKVRVYGHFMELDSGRDLEGVLNLRVDKILQYVPTGQQVMTGAFRPIRFNREGFSVYLPATDDPQLTPAFQYIARLTVRGIRQEFTFSLPSATPEVNITDLIS